MTYEKNKERHFLFCMKVKAERVDEFIKWTNDHVRTTLKNDKGCISFVF